MATYASSVQIVEGTFGQDVNFQAQDADGSPFDLTGWTVKWCVYLEGSTRYKLLVTCEAVDLAQGKLKYTLQESDWGQNKLQGGEIYQSVLIATKTGYKEEFRGLKVTILAKAPTEPTA
jgi:hypothetical protein